MYSMMSQGAFGFDAAVDVAIADRSFLKKQAEMLGASTPA
jgi:hypothetical protein